MTGDGKPKRITRIDPTKLDVDVQNKLKSALARIKGDCMRKMDNVSYTCPC